MPTELQITEEIECKIDYYSSWTIGITDDPRKRKEEHGNPQTWHDWYAITESVARNIERFFLTKGMKGNTLGGIEPIYLSSLVL